MLKKSKMMILMITGLIICLIAMTFVTGCGSSSEQEAPAEEPATEEPATEEPATEEPATEEPAAEEPAEQQKEIGEDKALEIALKDAGVNKGDITNPFVNLEVDDGRTEYEVEFNVGTTEYDYSIDAFKGDIIEKDVDNDND